MRKWLIVDELIARTEEIYLRGTTCAAQVSGATRLGTH